MAAAITLSINDDILREVAFSSPPDTCARLMLTCRYLYHEAAKSTLQHEVYLGCDAQIDKFLRFLVAEDHTRFRYVRSLRLHLNLLSSDLVQKLFDNIAHMTRLTSLEMSDGELALETYPYIGDAVKRITSLQHLGSCTAGWLVIAILNDLNCDLTSINLDWGAVVDESFRDNRMKRETLLQYHPVPFLSKWTHSLSELRCSGGRTLNIPGDPECTAVYPKMRKLTITCDNFPDPLPYIRAYPNLTHLSAVFGGFAHVESAHHRKRNLQRQLDPRGTGTWRHIEQYTGHLGSLYQLGLTCAIDRVRIDDPLLAESDFELLSEIIFHAKARHLKIACDGTLLLDQHTGLSATLLGYGASRLESLVVTILPRDKDMDIGSALDTLACALAILPVRRLRLLVEGVLLDPTRPYIGVPPAPASPPPYNFAERSLSKFDLEGFMWMLAETLPLLTDAIVRIHGPREHRQERKIEPSGGSYLASGLDRSLFEF
ncbi:hypothetical protein OH76DRAFT_512511 [Lentinus brumalis]|uniref:F-box domain-containing protein n=1 Tax=Lentinus brumalis TaxID=2498619 RepID=A0A371DB70_9APHY|nr:hypothetical protein OH76DRAFT_512511 [Polyporus brumalis]